MLTDVYNDSILKCLCMPIKSVLHILRMRVVLVPRATDTPNLDMAQRQRYLRALRNDRNLARFVVEGRATGRQLGTGSYGSVEEVRKAHENCFTRSLNALDHPTYLPGRS